MYRLMRENRMGIANPNDPEEIRLDWEYPKKNVVPQLDKIIDAWQIVQKFLPE